MKKGDLGNICLVCEELGGDSPVPCAKDGFCPYSDDKQERDDPSGQPVPAEYDSVGGGSC